MSRRVNWTQSQTVEAIVITAGGRDATVEDERGQRWIVDCPRRLVVGPGCRVRVRVGSAGRSIVEVIEWPS